MREVISNHTQFCVTEEKDIQPKNSKVLGELIFVVYLLSFLAIAKEGQCQDVLGMSQCLRSKPNGKHYSPPKIVNKGYLQKYVPNE